MTTQRYCNRANGMQPDAEGPFVLFEDAQRTIKRLGEELFQARMQLVALEKQHKADIADKDVRIERLCQQKRAAVIALGYDDPEDL